MRKDKYWSSSSSGRSSSSSSKKRDQQKKTCRSSSNGGTTATTAAAATTVGGCMSAMFQLFDFHTHSSSFRFTSSSVVVHEETKPPGIEAPRNSLEVDESTISSSSSNPKIQDSLSLKMGIQIKTKTDKRDSVCSEVSSSPGTRTPTLVARLMGLDLLPDSTSSSPRPSSTNGSGSTPNSLPTHSRTNRARHLLRGRKSCSDVESGSQSVPAKVSLSRRSDVDHYHRPSMNKENTDFDLSRLIRKQVKSGDEEGLSPGHYARQIVKQVKETVSRRSAMSDVTNVVRRDQLVISNQLKREKVRPAEVDGGSRLRYHHEAPHRPPPPLQSALATEEAAGDRFLSRRRAAEVDGGSRLRYHNEAPNRPPPLQSALATEEAAGDRFLSRRSTRPATAAADVVMRNRLQEETYARPSPAARGGNVGVTADKRSCKKTTALLSGMRSVGGGCGGGGVPTVLPIKKDPSPPATKIPVKHQQQPHDTAPQSNNTSHLSTTRHRHAAATTTAKLAELHYVSSIFKCMNINLSPNSPLPSSFTTHFIFSTKTPIFDDFRTRISFLSDTVGLKCNRKLLLDLVEELTFDFFKPFRNFDRVSPVGRYRRYGHVTLGLELVNAVKARVESFPRAECHVLEDIDAIIDVDLKDTPPAAAAAEEGGEVAAEIEGYIWNGLMQELAGDVITV